MSDIHIDDFYRDLAKILVLLYSTFPRKVTLYVEDISGPDVPDDFGLHSPRHEACFHTMLWLANADYIHFGQIVRQEALDQTVLTHRAFMLLNSSLPEPVGHNHEELKQLPNAVADQELLVVNHIRHQLKQGTSFTLAALMRQIMGLSREFS